MIIHVLYNLCFLLLKRIGINLGCNVAVEPCAVDLLAVQVGSANQRTVYAKDVNLVLGTGGNI